MLHIVTTLLTNQCDIEKGDQSESEHCASLNSESSDSKKSPSTFLHHNLPPPPPRPPHCHLPRSAGPGADRCVGRAGRAWRTGRQRSPTSSQPYPRGRQTNDLLFILFHFAAGASAMELLVVVSVHDKSCELEELLYHLLLKVKVLSAPRELPSRHTVLRHSVIHRRLTLTVVCHFVSYQASANDRLLFSLGTDHKCKLLSEDCCRDIGICISGINDNRVSVA